MAEHVGTTATPSEEVNGGATATEENNTETQKDAETIAPSTAAGETAAEETTSKDTEATPIIQSSTTEGKKRKFASDDRDWRTRRDEDNAHSSSNKRETRSSATKPYGSYNENVKSDYSSVPESSDPDEIRKQVEFYFSDSNLPTDRFLLQQTGGAANKPVPIKVIHSFKRMRHFQPYSAIVAALRESDFLTVNDDEEVARQTPIPENMLPGADANVRLFDDVTRPRSIYAKGFGQEGPTTQFDIEAFFAPYGPTNAIRLRRTVPDKVFKGSVFVEFDSEETAKTFLALDPKPKFEGRDLLIMSKEEYVTKKAKEVADGKIPSNSWRGRGSGSRGRGSSRGGRGGRGGHRGDRHGRRDDRGRGRDGGRDKRARDDDNEGEATSAAAEAKKPKLDDTAAADVGKPSEGTSTTGPPGDKKPETQAALAGST